MPVQLVPGQDPVALPDRDNQLGAFTRWVSAELGVSAADYADLWSWSVGDLEAFWPAVRRFLRVPMSVGQVDVLTGEMPAVSWFRGATTNFVNPLADDAGGDRPALVGVTEVGTTARLTHAELRRQAASLAAVLTGLGVRPGDRVVAYLPNVVETVVAFYATASIGAVWASVGADYEPDAAIARLAQLRPSVLIGADGYRFRGRDHDRRPALAAVAAGIGVGVDHVIVVPSLQLGPTAGSHDNLDWAECIADQREWTPLQVPFDHPLWVLFSSGTTGRPKGIVHGHGGAQLELHKTLALHMDVDRDSRVLWATSPSWVVWNTLAAVPLRGACAVTYDGSPTHPDAAALWRVAAEHEVTVMGTSPAFLAATERAGVRPGRSFDLSALQLVLSTGSPLPARTSTWFSTAVTGTAPLVSVSGGTDVVGAFVGGVPGDPVVPGQIQGRCLGVALEAWDADGRSVVGDVGELVVTRPMPSMPLRFWDDPDGARLRAAYFDTYPGIWRHGDWITVTAGGSVVVHGRSDSTLNRNGIRMGSGDIYDALQAVEEVVDALVVGAEVGDGGYWMPLFVTLAPGSALDAELRGRIESAIRLHASPRHVPDDVIEVPGIPHTRTGKRLEVPVKRLLQGAAVDAVVARSAVDDPSLLDFFHGLVPPGAVR